MELALGSAVERVELDRARRVLQVLDDQDPLADRDGFDHRVGALGDQHLPGFALRPRQVDGQNPAVGRAERGREEECVADDRAGGFGVEPDRDRDLPQLAAGDEVRDRRDPEVVGAGAGAVDQPEPLPVLREVGAGTAGGRELGVFVGAELAEDQPVLLDRFAQPMEENLTGVRVLRVRKIAVEEAAAVRQPVAARDLAADRSASVTPDSTSSTLSVVISSPAR